MIGRPPGLRRFDPIEAKLGKIEAYRQTRRSPEPDCSRRSSLPGIQGKACSARDPPPQQSASSDPPKIVAGIISRPSHKAPRFHTARVMSALGVTSGPGLLSLQQRKSAQRSLLPPLKILHAPASARASTPRTAGRSPLLRPLRSFEANQAPTVASYTSTSYVSNLHGAIRAMCPGSL
jgi:hypothetical protein